MYALTAYQMMFLDTPIISTPNRTYRKMHHEVEYELKISVSTETGFPKSPVTNEPEDDGRLCENFTTRFIHMGQV